jgi:hypothetical protein
VQMFWGTDEVKGSISTHVRKYLSAPILFRSSRVWGLTVLDAIPRYVLKRNISPNCLSIREMIALCWWISPQV